MLNYLYDNKLNKIVAVISFLMIISLRSSVKKFIYFMCYCERKKKYLEQIGIDLAVFVAERTSFGRWRRVYSSSTELTVSINYSKRLSVK